MTGDYPRACGETGIEDVDGGELPFSDEHLKAIVTVPYFAAAAVDAYYGRFFLQKNS